tara:strand:- start:162 stop:443 length:282 start_codon:yes stop_codon:yes gene_type:complete
MKKFEKPNVTVRSAEGVTAFKLTCESIPKMAPQAMLILWAISQCTNKTGVASVEDVVDFLQKVDDFKTVQPVIKVIRHYQKALVERSCIELIA